MQLLAKKTPRGIILIDMDEDNIRAVVEIYEPLTDEESVDSIKEHIERMTKRKRDQGNYQADRGQ